MICPACGSARCKSPELEEAAAAICLDCLQLFVPENRIRPEIQMCDDCAFRPNSLERADGYKWAEIIEVTIVEAQHPFYCHKGLRCELKGQSLCYLQPPGGQAEMTPCAGWRAHKMAYEAGIPARKL